MYPSPREVGYKGPWAAAVPASLFFLPRMADEVGLLLAKGTIPVYVRGALCVCFCDVGLPQSIHCFPQRRRYAPTLLPYTYFPGMCTGHAHSHLLETCPWHKGTFWTAPSSLPTPTADLGDNVAASFLPRLAGSEALSFQIPLIGNIHTHMRARVREVQRTRLEWVGE